MITSPKHYSYRRVSRVKGIELMTFRSYPREKDNSLAFRHTWRMYYLIRKLLPPKSLLKILLQSIWTLNAITWEQARFFERDSGVSSKPDLLRPRNVSDAISGVGVSDLVCDFGGGLGDISDALLRIGSRVVYCDTSILFQEHVSQRFINFPDFSVKSPQDVLEGREGRFNLTILSHVLEHIDSPADFLNKISKVSEKVHIEVPDLRSDSLNFVRMELDLPIYKDEDHVTEMSIDFLKELIENCNFTVDSIVSRDGCLVAKATSITV